MAYVKDAGVGADGLVLVVDAGIADGHVIARELNHFGAQRQVLLCKGSGLHVV